MHITSILVPRMAAFGLQGEPGRAEDMSLLLQNHPQRNTNSLSHAASTTAAAGQVDDASRALPSPRPCRRRSRWRGGPGPGGRGRRASWRRKWGAAGGGSMKCMARSDRGQRRGGSYECTSFLPSCLVGHRI